METTLEKVTTEALRLSLNDRAALADVLLQSLDEEPSGDAEAVEHAWAQEVERRVDDVLSGRLKGIPAEEVFADLPVKQG
jgi:putative addiction module component (TIGR02574 family)